MSQNTAPDYTNPQVVPVNGLVPVVQGVTGQSHNRYMSAAATTWAAATNECTFSPGVTEITVTVPTTASLTEVLILSDSPSDAFTAAAFAAGIVTSTSVDLQIVPILPNAQPKTLYFTSPITRIDFLPIGAACKIWVEAN